MTNPIKLTLLVAFCAVFAVGVAGGADLNSTCETNLALLDGNSEGFATLAHSLMQRYLPDQYPLEARLGVMANLLKIHNSDESLARPSETTVELYAKSALKLSGHVKATSTPTVPTSPANVFMIQNETQEVAVVKIFPSVETFLWELAAIKAVSAARFEHLRPVKVLDVKKILLNGVEKPVLLMSRAHGTDLEELLRQVGNRNEPHRLAIMEDAVREVALGLSELHNFFQNKDRDRSSVQFVIDYEASRLSTFLVPGGTIDRFSQAGWLDATEEKNLRLKLTQVIEDFKKSPAPVSTRIMGDSHQGNFFYDKSPRPAESIDLQTFVWSSRSDLDTGVEYGVSDGLSDIGRFYGALEVNGFASGLTDLEVKHLQDLTLQTYLSHVSGARPDLKEKLEFFSLRFFANVLEDFTNKKSSEVFRRRLFDRMLVELGIRQPASPLSEEHYRGDVQEYARYYGGMAQTDKQKVALVSANLPMQGVVVDAGSGPGSTTYDLASLYPNLEFFGQDINPQNFQYATQTYQRRNLRFLLGDVAAPYFLPNSIDAFINSSIFHEVNSFSGQDLVAIYRILDNEVRALKEDRLEFVRDFVLPSENHIIFVDYPANDGEATGSIKNLSTAAAFRVFARDFKNLKYPQGHVPYQQVASPYQGFERFLVEERMENEFTLRKGYRATQKNWDSELKESYGFFTEDDYYYSYLERGLRVLISKPYWNPWIIDNRVEGQVFRHDLAGNRLPHSPTNFINIGIKVGEKRGILLQEKKHGIVVTPRFLKLEHFQNRKTGQIYDLVSRPNETVDLMPWFESDGAIYVVDRQQYPRPIVNAVEVGGTLNRGRTSGYLTEPLTGMVKPHLSRAENVSEILREMAGLTESDVVSVGKDFTYYPSPGGINELVHSRAVQIKPRLNSFSLSLDRSGFTESGFTGAVDAEQTLRSYQVGGMSDSRLEINIYKLLLDLKRQVGPWIGANLNFKIAAKPARVEKMIDLLTAKKTTLFTKVSQSANYLDVREGEFSEVNSKGDVLKTVSLEYVTTKNRNTVLALPVVKTRCGYFVGLEEKNLPAVEISQGHASLLTSPGFRLRSQVKNPDEARQFVREAMLNHFGLQVQTVTPLGGEYYVSPGITPELVFPFVVQVESETAVPNPVHWVALDDILSHRDELQDAQLLNAIYRFAHSVSALR